MTEATRPVLGERLADLLQELLLALRALRRAPGFTAVAVLSLAAGIGANTALFTVAGGLWLAPVPGVAGADRVAEILMSRAGSEMQEWPYPDLVEVRAAETPFEAIAGWKMSFGSLTVDEVGEHVMVGYVTSGYFEVMGAEPTMGRAFAAAEDEGPGQHPVAVLSEALWRQRYGADPDIVGRTVTLDRTPYTVIGVAPPDFRGQLVFEQVDLWVPLAQHYLARDDGWLEQRGAHWVLAVGRLRDGATLAQANAALGTVFARLAQEYPATNEGKSARAASFGAFPALSRTDDLVAMGLVGALMGLVLLIICGNVAGMLLARSATREREIAVRLALGSGRVRLLRHLMTEAVVVGVAGGTLGVVFDLWGLALIGSFTTEAQVPRTALLHGWPTLIPSLVFTTLTILAVGLLPALRFSRPELLGSLKDESGGGARRVGRVHRLAASAQVGVALLFLVVCSLFVRALDAMEARDLGFRPDGLLVSILDLEMEGYGTEESGQAFLRELREAVGAVPGVTSVASGDGLPVDLVGNFTSVRAQAPREGDAGTQVEFTRAGAGYFEAIGARLLRGRGFIAADDAAAPKVVVIARSLAERLWPGEDALGRQLWTTLTRDPAGAHTVVGVIADTASSRATDDWPQIYLPQRQNYYRRATLVIRSAADPGAVIDPIRAAILAVDPTITPPTIVTSSDLVYQATQPQRMTATLAGGFGLLTLVLSAIGVYGVVAFAVASRTREIGVRMALGAARGRVLREVLGDALRLAFPGLVLGGLAAVAVALASQSVLFGLSPVDPLSFSLSAGVIFLIVVLASLVPARRASAIDPMDAVRSE